MSNIAGNNDEHAKADGGYFDQLLEPGGWPEIDEDAFYERAQEFTQVLRQVTEVLESCQQRRTQVFDDVSGRVVPPMPPTANSAPISVT
ncbi:ESX-1 secretion-associated EspK domain protein [Mycobacterium ulcerans str. Harvey]|uniref:ESX-1 secretion-associated EspK domain protein n=1 Tax=Mycobacterium ulcerans str. Harvey TaxID=1299332 RepID=A0ABN0RAM1_MYCUL|nr:ESX-1 secretion-associated EspK domain protein [Mycobacterium ulcerans str. Harvey]